MIRHHRSRNGQLSDQSACVHSELERSKLVDQLVDATAKHVKTFGAAEVSLALDGLARLRCQPPTVLLDALAQQVISHSHHLHALKAGPSACVSTSSPLL